MADTKLSALTAGGVAAQYYGIDSTNNSRRYADMAMFNVKSPVYGAIGDGVHDDTTNIQAAITAAAAAQGGIIFFPPGRYKTTAALIDPGTFSHGCILKGSGCAYQATAGHGTMIDANFNDYILKTAHLTPGVDNNIGGLIDSTIFKSIEDIGFVNAFRPTNPIADTEATPGGLYISGNIGISILRCDLAISGGIAFRGNSSTSYMSCCNIIGGYDGNNGAYKSFGAVVDSMVIENCRITFCGIGVLQRTQHTGWVVLRNVDFERCGSGVVSGYSPIGIYNPLSNAVDGAGNGIGAVGIDTVSMESIGETDNTGLNSFFWLRGSAISDGLAMASYAQGGVPKYGLYLDVVSNSRFQGLSMDGGNSQFSQAAVRIGTSKANKFTSCNAFTTAGGGVAWSLMSGADGNPGADGTSFEYCNTSGATPILSGSGAFNVFPLSPKKADQTMMSSDCNDPAWTGTVSNVGKPVSWAGTTNASTAIGNGTITFPSGVPTYIQAGWSVFNQTNPLSSLAAGTTVASRTATTIVIVNPAVFNTGGVASGDVIGVATGGGTNQVLLRWTGDYTTAAGGAWAIAG